MQVPIHISLIVCHLIYVICKQIVQAKCPCALCLHVYSFLRVVVEGYDSRTAHVVSARSELLQIVNHTETRTKVEVFARGDDIAKLSAEFDAQLAFCVHSSTVESPVNHRLVQILVERRSSRSETGRATKRPRAAS